MEFRKGIKHVKSVHIDDCCVDRKLGSAQFDQGRKTLQNNLLYAAQYTKIKSATINI